MTQPLVIDFELRTDGFWIIVQNISGGPLTSFTAQFSDINMGMPITISGMPIRGNPAGARTIISDYEIFKKCGYLAPGKRFELFVENDRVFFEINPSEFNIVISAADTNNQMHHYTISHNLKIYKQLIHTTIVNQ